MTRSHPLVLASAAAAGLLCNYWALEDLLADRASFDGAWISDLSTRSESPGGFFVTLAFGAWLPALAWAAVQDSGAG